MVVYDVAIYTTASASINTSYKRKRKNWRIMNQSTIYYVHLVAHR